MSTKQALQHVRYGGPGTATASTPVADGPGRLYLDRRGKKVVCYRYRADFTREALTVPDRDDWLFHFTNEC